MTTRRNVAKPAPTISAEDAAYDAAVAYWDAVYGILVTHAGAREDERTSFVAYFIRDTEGGLGSEYRFRGSLGFGGKCYMTPLGHARVSCYSEDRTPERDATIAKCMDLFGALVYSRTEQA